MQLIELPFGRLSNIWQKSDFEIFFIFELKFVNLAAPVGDPAADFLAGDLAMVPDVGAPGGDIQEFTVRVNKIHFCP